jgi:hypothetical protein
MVTSIKTNNISIKVINLGVRKEKIRQIKELYFRGIKVDYPQFPTKLAFLISMLKNAKYNIKALDLAVENWWNDRLNEMEALASFLAESPDLILIYQTAYGLPEIQRLAQILKHFGSVLPKSGFILTLPNATKKMAILLMDKIKDYLSANIYSRVVSIYGEIELPFISSSSNLSLKKLKESPNVLYYNSNQLKSNPIQYLNRSLMNEIPMPDFKELKPEKYLQISSYIPLNLSRGCPYHCKHCAVHEVYGKVWKSFRLSKIREMLSQMKDLIGEKVIYSMSDQDIIFDLEWFEGICRIFNELGIQWECKLRPEWINEKTISSIVRSGGCKNIALSADVLYEYNPALAESIGKVITLDILKKAFSICEKNGIEASLAVIPEFYPSSESIIKVAKECNTSSVVLCPLHPFDLLPSDDLVISSDLEKNIKDLLNEGIKISIFSGMGEEGW